MEKSMRDFMTAKERLCFKKSSFVESFGWGILTGLVFITYFVSFINFGSK